MSNWGGFSEDDLRRMKQNVKQSNESSTQRQPHFGARRTRPPRSEARPQHRPVQHNLPPEQRLAPPPPKPAQPLKEQRKNSSETTQVSDTGTGQINQSKKEKSDQTEDAANKETEKEDRTIIDDEEILNLEMSNLDKFRSQQKQIEELNKKKRQILASAIVERQKKAKAESVKLTRIQKELEKLDQMLTVDVSLIRDRIEDSSRHYLDAQKRFERAEKEYITAKMELFKEQEQKEQLTEHLYTVIQQNEIRKAQKLKELMEKLEMESDSDNNDVTELIQSMTTPSLTVLNAMTMQRIGGPTHPKSPPADKADKGISQPAESQANSNQTIDGRSPNPTQSQVPSTQSETPPIQFQAVSTQPQATPSSQNDHSLIGGANNNPATTQSDISLNNASKQTESETAEKHDQTESQTVTLKGDKQTCPPNETHNSSEITTTSTDSKASTAKNEQPKDKSQTANLNDEQNKSSNENKSTTDTHAKSSNT